MSTTEDEKIKNWYNANMKTHPKINTSLPHDTPTQDLWVKEEEEMKPKENKAAPK